MKFDQIYTSERVSLSFELFPPKSDAAVEDLYQAVEELQHFSPDYYTVTYGAGGSTQDKTLAIAAEIKRRFQMPVASHLTCVGSTRSELLNYLKTANERGIDFIVALRGDPPKGEDAFKAVEGGLSYANELVTLIREQYPEHGIAVAGYPEVHQECPSEELDLQNLARKVDAGANLIITQLFYDNDDFYRFRDRCVAAGIDVPIIPGLLPVLSLKQVQRIASLCKAKLPPAFVERLSQQDDPQWQFDVGVEHAIEQTNGLLKSGVPGLHFLCSQQSQSYQTDP